jgi:hypothetical protein
MQKAVQRVVCLVTRRADVMAGQMDTSLVGSSASYLANCLAEHWAAHSVVRWVV